MAIITKSSPDTVRNVLKSAISKISDKNMGDYLGLLVLIIISGKKTKGGYSMLKRLVSVTSHVRYDEG